MHQNKELIILIPHFNNLKGLKDSLKSVDENFEIDVMIVDDGSLEKPDVNTITKYYRNGKVYIEYLNENSGISIAANKGIKKIEELGYKFIARLDCGDICLPNRFLLQLSYLKEKPEIKVLGGWASAKNNKGDLEYIMKPPTDYKTIQKKMYINSMFIHPTIVFYTHIAKEVGYYDPKYSRAAQDYAFLFEIIKRYKAENLPEILIDYLIDDDSASTKRRKLQVRNRIKIMTKHFYFGFYPIFGLLRTLPLYFISRKSSQKLKKILNMLDK